MSLSLPQGMQINAPILPGFETILTLPALELVAKLHRQFEPTRQALLAKRQLEAQRRQLRATDPVLKRNGARTDYWKTGHSYIKRRVAELGAIATER